MVFYFIGSLKYALFQKVESINITGNVGMVKRWHNSVTDLGSYSNGQEEFLVP